MDHVRQILEAKKPSKSSGSDSVEAVQTARARPSDLDFEQVGSVWALLRDHSAGPNPDSLRRANMVRMVDRSVLSLRRPPTVEPGKHYLTIDTACENTVCGTSFLEGPDSLLERLTQNNPKSACPFRRVYQGPPSSSDHR